MSGFGARDLPPVEYWDRYKAAVTREAVYAEGFIRWCYGSNLGRLCLESIFSRRAFNEIYGIYKRSALSRGKIVRDIARFNLDMENFESSTYQSYAEFFLRRFRPGIRPFAKDEDCLPAFCEGKFLGFYEVNEQLRFPVKGVDLNLTDLLKDEKWAAEFSGGPMLICRLSPIDYHWFHYPDDGETLATYGINGHLDSVNILALQSRSDIFLRNERRISILQTKRFKKIAYIEVGAMCVGRIIQTHDTALPFSRGDYKGHFQFGASTVILLGQKGSWLPDKDIVEQTSAKRETVIQLGDSIARRIGRVEHSRSTLT